MRTRVRTIIRHHSGLIAALILTVLLKAILLALDVVPFNADEAVVALMAKHILQGERPVFFYGQAYLGSTDAWLIAGAFLLLGQRVLSIRIVQTLLYLGTVVITYALGLKIYKDRWTATVAALLLSLPPVLVTLYTTATLGGYGEALLIGNGLLLWTLRLREADRGWWEWALFGGLAGFGFFTFGLVGVYLVPVGIALILPPIGEKLNLGGYWPRSTKTYLPAAIGFAIGSLPWWWATLFGAATVTELGGSAIATETGLLTTLVIRGLGLFVLGPTVLVGLRPPWAIRWLALPLAPLALILFFATLGWVVRSGRERPAVRLLIGVALTLCAAFLLTPFGNDPSGRYFLPLVPLMALFTADLFNRIRASYPRLAPTLVVGLLAFQLWGNIESAFTYPPGITTQFDAVAQVNQRDLPAVVEFLRAHGETRGYTNYWVSFPLAFLSDEQLIFTAALPYHEDFRYTVRDNRYGPYNALVSASQRTAYITTRHPELDARLRASFESLNIQFSETTLGDFHIFYGLSRPVTPQEIGLGIECCSDRP